MSRVVTRSSLAVAGALALALAAPPARAGRLDAEVAVGGGGFATGGGSRRVGVGAAAGVGVAFGRRVAVGLRVGWLRTFDGEAHPGYLSIGPAVRVHASDRVFFGLGLGLAGANGAGPAVAARLGVVAVEARRGAVDVAVEAVAAAALDGDSSDSRALVVTVGYRLR